MINQSVELGSIARFFSGNAWKSERFTRDPSGMPLIRIQNVDAVRDSEFIFWPDEYDRRFLVSAGDLLLTLSGSFRAAIWNGPQALLNQRIVKITPAKGIDKSWLFWWLQHAIDRIAKLGRHALVSNVALSDLKVLRLNPPPLSEQKRIAMILDKADQLRQKRKQAIALLDSLTQSIFLDMFGELNSQVWHSAKISEVALNMRTGPFGSQLLHSEFVDEGIAVLGIDNAVSNRFEWGKARFISKKKYQELLRYTVKPNDVLITIMGTCGRCVVVPKDIPTAINTKHLCCITLNQNKILPEYLHACFLNNQSVLRQLGVLTKGAVMPGLNMGIIKSLVIPIPPISLQERFRDVLARAVKQIRFSEKAASHADLLFASLQHRAFSGQL